MTFSHSLGQKQTFGDTTRKVCSLYEPVGVKVVLSRRASSALHVLSPYCREQVRREVRGTCDDRIALYPAAPIRLATMLYARTIALRMGLIWGTALSPYGLPATHPTRQRARRPVELVYPLLPAVVLIWL